MNLPLVIELTILALAIFLGFEVISKVPAMLHTPLMSGTNFIHGIVIVGAIIVLGEADDTYLKVIGFVAMVLATRERRRRLVRHRPHAGDVQEAARAAQESREAERGDLPDSNIIGLLYLVTIVCFILALRFLSSPKHARRGNWVGGVGMLSRSSSTLLLDGIGELGTDRRRRPRSAPPSASSARAR